MTAWAGETGTRAPLYRYNSDEPDEWKQEHLTVLFVQENFDIIDVYSQEAESRCGAIRPVHLLIRDLGNA